MAIQKIKLDVGTVYQKEEGGGYYFRYQINGARKAISLKTRNRKEAIKAAEQQIPLLKATSTEVIAAHVKYARGLVRSENSLLLSHAWEVYSQSPERATPDTVSETLAYQATLQELIDFLADPTLTVRDVDPEKAAAYANSLRGCKLAVSTHNRKIKRLRRIFRVLRDYREGENPFQSSSLLRKEREEREQDVHRLSFSREQEQQLRDVLADDKYKVMNKAEVRVIYYLGMYTGQRLKDCVLLRWSKIDFQLQRIWVKQFKTGKEVVIPIAPLLEEVLQEALAWKTENDYVCSRIAPLDLQQFQRQSRLVRKDFRHFRRVVLPIAPVVKRDLVGGTPQYAPSRLRHIAKFRKGGVAGKVPGERLQNLHALSVFPARKNRTPCGWSRPAEECFSWSYPLLPKSLSCVHAHQMDSQPASR